MAVTGIGIVPNGLLKTRLAIFDDLDDKIGVMTFCHECFMFNQSYINDKF
jgi:hypothetical protein